MTFHLADDFFTLSITSVFVFHGCFPCVFFPCVFSVGVFAVGVFRGCFLFCDVGGGSVCFFLLCYKKLGIARRQSTDIFMLDTSDHWGDAKCPSAKYLDASLCARYNCDPSPIQLSGTK